MQANGIIEIFVVFVDNNVKEGKLDVRKSSYTSKKTTFLKNCFYRPDNKFSKKILWFPFPIQLSRRGDLE